MHVDGNMKNFNHDHGKEPWREPYHQGVFLTDDAEVLEHMRSCDTLMGRAATVRVECASCPALLQWPGIVP